MIPGAKPGEKRCLGPFRSPEPESRLAGQLRPRAPSGEWALLQTHLRVKPQPPRLQVSTCTSRPSPNAEQGPVPGCTSPSGQVLPNRAISSLPRTPVPGSRTPLRPGRMGHLSLPPGKSHSAQEGQQTAWAPPHSHTSGPDRGPHGGRWPLQSWEPGGGSGISAANDK